jgi:hypothetical protein
MSFRQSRYLTCREVNEVLTLVRSLCPCESLTLEIHDRGLLWQSVTA